ncbi:bifunctional phosphopantothenoylcysteine decarboxylase/phosphopantothenate--cysteine ligase CoaBC [Limosilactobacillus ingluviei]|uniref:bifunctional phosphopantothenoylcysteine decarboxylase/phosphopantothenate--cysteine ligase CoaBC n=1 Tax=Limosilactobacillus ingluviei TaxID=148604 RepID=UPI00030C21F4|nr:bifunctional phosphopantothenoylcysteine decarboxylase/phosphopantothenate--cysteine ligase CoaBC [Limosilactobacillus ingluviei]
MAKIAVYVSGSVAAFKAVSVVRQLQKAGHQVRVGLTAAGAKFVSPTTFYALTHTPVLVDLWQGDQGPVPHIEWADWTDLALVVPASADLLAKMAQGIADDAVSAALLATSAPIMVAPAMNTHMWENPATQRNLAQLAADGKQILTPTTGMLAEGYAGKGRMVEPAEIVAAVTTFLTASTRLANRHLLVTAGGTREPLDPVRYIGNRSSGKMGVAIVKAALAAGAKVTLIAGTVQVALPTHPRLTVQRVTTTAEMLAAAQDAFPTVDAVVMAAAVADFRPATVSDQKIKKQAGQEAFTVQLVKNPDILATLGAKKTTQVIMGFAAETNDLLAHAKEKLAKKHADYIVANDVSQAGSGFGVPTDQVTILTPDQAPQAWPLLTKQEVGHRLVALLAARLAK